MDVDEPCPNCKGTGKIRTNILRKLREKKGVDQAVVAKLLGLGQSGYSYLETNWRGMRWNKHSRALADFFGVSVEQLMGREPLVPLSKPARPKRKAPLASLLKSRKARLEKARKNRRRR